MDGWRHGRTDGDFHLSQFFGPFPEPVAIDGGQFTDWAFFLAPGWRGYNHASLEEVCAFQWMSANRLALDAQAVDPAGPVDPPALRGHLRAPGRDVPRCLRAAGRSLHRRRCVRAASNLQPTSIVKGKPQRQKWREQQPGGHRAHPAGDPPADAARWATTRMTEPARPLAMTHHPPGQRHHPRLQRRRLRAPRRGQRAGADAARLRTAGGRRRQHRRHAGRAGRLRRAPARADEGQRRPSRRHATTACAHARGDYVAFLDADDWLAAGQAGAAGGSCWTPGPTIGFCSTATRVVDARDGTVGRLALLRQRRAAARVLFMHGAAISGSTSGVLARRALLIEARRLRRAPARLRGSGPVDPPGCARRLRLHPRAADGGGAHARQRQQPSAEHARRDAGLVPQEPRTASAGPARRVTGVPPAPGR